MSDPLAALLERAELAMTTSGKRDVRLGTATVLTDAGRRSTVARVQVDAGPKGTPTTVIVKQVRAESGESGSAEHDRARRRLLTEVTTLDFLGSLPTPISMGPRLLGVDLDAGVLVLEDLGEGVSLADLLTGDDSGAATAALNAYARSLARLHAETVGRAEAFAAIGRKYGHVPAPGSNPLEKGVADMVPRFKQACDLVSVPLDEAFQRDAATIDRALSDPGPWLALNVSDACPDNHVLQGKSVRFFDFEFSNYGHALLDGAYLRVPFPTCWCAARIPDDVQAQAERIYRMELASACPLAAVDEEFEEAMLMACARWTIATVSWTLERTVREDDLWGLLSHRQRHILRLESLARSLEASGRLSEIKRVAAALARELRTRWPNIEAQMPLYPAFQSTPPAIGTP
jgi:hypothetical protein